MSNAFCQCMHKNLCMTKGDTFAFGLKFSDIQTLNSAAFTVSTEQEDGTTVISKTIANGGITKISDNQYQVRIAPEDTSSVSPSRYFYTLKITIGSDVFTILKGVMLVEWEVS